MIEGVGDGAISTCDYKRAVACVDQGNAKEQGIQWYQAPAPLRRRLSASMGYGYECSISTPRIFPRNLRTNQDHFLSPPPGAIAGLGGLAEGIAAGLPADLFDGLGGIVLAAGGLFGAT